MASNIGSEKVFAISVQEIDDLNDLKNGFHEEIKLLIKKILLETQFITRTAATHPKGNFFLLILSFLLSIKVIQIAAFLATKRIAAYKNDISEIEEKLFYIQQETLQRDPSASQLYDNFASGIYVPNTLNV